MAANEIITLLRHHREYVEAFLRNVVNTGRRLGVKDVHRMRVDIKRMRAMAEFLEVVSSGEYQRKQHVTALIPVFRAAGVLRETHVNLGMVLRNESPSLSAYKAFLLKSRLIAARKLHAALREFDKTNFKNSVIVTRRVIRSIDPSSIRILSRAFLKRKARRIVRLRSGLSSDERIHTIRKALKSMMAITDFFVEIAPETRQKKFVPDLAHCEELIGEWHNRSVLIDSLVLFTRDNGSGAPSRETQRYIETIRKTNRRSVKDIHRELGRLLRHLKFLQ